MQDEIQKWMVGLGFELKGKISNDNLWLKSGLPPISEAEAAFFYQVTQREVVEARKDEVNNIVKDEYFHPSGRHIGAVKYHVQRYKELKQQRQKLGERK
jgi:hypothetical protein